MSASSASAVLGGLYDYGYVLQRALEGSARARFFSGGFADAQLAAVDAHFGRLLERLRAGRCAAELDAPLALEGAAEDLGAPPPPPRAPGGSCGACGCGRGRRAAPPLRAVVMREASARSPLAALLDGGAERMQLLYVADERAARPWEGAASRGQLSAAAAAAASATATAAPPAGIAVVLPATGEQGYRDRLEVARTLISRAAQPTAVLILMAPYYASRKPAGQRGHFSRTVGAYQAQSAAISMEAAALLAWAHAFAPRARLCATGFSWGAAMASGASMLASLALPSGVAARQLCVAPYVGSASPVALLTGLLAMDVDFRALEAEGGGAARERLLAIFRRSNFRAFLDAMRESAALASAPLVGAVSSVSMGSDAFVSQTEARQLHEMLADAAAQASQAARVRAVVHGGGHASAAARRGVWQVAAIEDALAMLPGGESAR